MNITQAKAVAGIAPHIKLPGIKGAEYGLAQVKQRMVEARRSPLGEGHPELPALSAAKVFFRQMTNRFCPVCDAPIARGAKACRIHSRPQSKMLAAPAGSKPIEQDWHKGKANARISVVTNPLALAGYYTPPIQKVVAKWGGTIQEETLKGYFVAVWPVARHKGTFLNIKGVEPRDWPAVFELGLAACAVYGNKNKLPFWLLTLPIHTGPNYRFPSHADIAATIRKHGGKDFTAGAIQKALTSMKLGTGRDEAKQARHDFAKIRMLHLKRQKVEPQPVEPQPVETETA